MKDVVTAASFRRKKEDGEKIAVLTAYDYPSAALMDEAGVDAVLVGEALARSKDVAATARAFVAAGRHQHP